MSLHDSLIVIARLLFTVIASGAWQSAKGGVATRYSSDEAVGQAVNDIIGKKA